ncbi:M67 family metallopeptidase [Pseudomonas chlororaphis]|uniref:M67 family metallopeptidase n=1 Tax=Pseudomonas chlororaphis TaxID=587753 RepID=UPI0030D148EC
MLTLPQSMLESIEVQAREAHPMECCGIIAGPEGTREPTRLIPMYNAAQSRDFFEFAPLEQLRVWREMEMRREEPLVIYHSHTCSRPYPSRTDIEYAAAHPEALHLIVCTDPRFTPAIRCYRIQQDEVYEVPLAFTSPTQSLSDRVVQ